MNEFYLRIRGVVSGPFSADELRARISSGELSPIHELSHDGSNWFRAGKIWEQLVATKILNRGGGEPPLSQPPAAKSVPPAAAPPPNARHAATKPQPRAAQRDDEDGPDDEDDAPADFVPAGETARARDFELRNLGILLSIAIVVLIGVLVWCLVFDWFKLDTIRPEHQTALGDAESFLFGAYRPHLVRTITEIVVAVVFFLWIYNTSRYLHKETGGYMKFSPAWSVGWFFIPVANFWKPYQVVAELRDKCDRLGGSGLRLQMPFPIVPAWWTVWLASFVSFRVLTAYERLVLRALDGPWESKAQQLHARMQIPIVLNNALLIEMLCLLIDLAAMVLTLVLIHEIDTLRPHHTSARTDTRPTS